MTFASEFDVRRNSLNAIRLLLAILVIVAHSWPLGGYGEAPGFGDQDLGDWAVAGFFAISGYLITASRVNSKSLLDYFWRRFLRIYPAFIVAMAFVAFVLAPISALWAGGQYSLGNAFGFVLNNSFVLMRQWGIEGTLEAVPYLSTWNGSAWTLFYELLCYIGIGVAITAFPGKYLRAVAIAAFVACVAVTTATHSFGVAVPEILALASRLGGFFMAGALLFLFREKIALNAVGAIAAVAALAGIVAASQFQVLAGLPVAYLMMYLGTNLPLTQIGARNDISYGMYIYAFPMQQMLASIFPAQELSVFMFVLISIALTTPLAWASWMVVERPAMRFKHLFKKRV